MRRFVLLLLLFVLPLQTLWAAGAGHCLSDGGAADHAAHSHEHDTAGHAHEHVGGAGHDAPGTDAAVDCSAFHFVALEALATVASELPRTGVLPFGPLSISFTSHIPPGPDRPRWRPAV
jgi:hypothetical protein